MHFQDAPHNFNPTTTDCPMNEMYKVIEHKQLKRPPPNLYVLVFQLYFY